MKRRLFACCCRLLPGQDHIELLLRKPDTVLMLMSNRRLSIW